jgi:hypothetical protein
MIVSTESVSKCIGSYNGVGSVRKRPCGFDLPFAAA